MAYHRKKQWEILRRGLVRENLLLRSLPRHARPLNKSLLLDAIARSLARTRRHGSNACAVAYINLNRFNLVNEGLGRSVGNQVLAEISRKLQALVREEDAVAHITEDKFAVLLENVGDVMGAIHAVQRIQEALESPTEAAGIEIFCSGSIGIAVGDGNNIGPEQLLDNAESAMHQASGRGYGQYQVFDPAMQERAIQLLRLETDLHRAIERNELRFEYQPIVCVGTGQIAGFEALLRWDHPQRGLLYPTDFIPVAERLGLHIPINHWVLKEASQQLADSPNQYPDPPPWFITVNITSHSLRNQELVREVSALVAENSFNPCGLVLEITEDQLVEDPKTATQVLADLKNLGIRIYLDDFGTGYSSLSYLAQFPVDALKIDRSFVSELTSDPKCQSIVRTIVSLAHNLGLDVVAEGVETEEQLGMLKQKKCQFVQGYYLSKPLRHDAVASFSDAWDAAKPAILCEE